MTAAASSLHRIPVSSMINNALDHLVDIALEKESRSHSLLNKTIVALSKTLFVAGNTLNLVVITVESLASGIIGAIALAVHLSRGCRSLSDQQFAIQCLSYCSHSASVPYIIYSMLFYKVPARQDLSTFSKHFQYGISAAEMHEELAPVFNSRAGRDYLATKSSGNQLFRSWLNNLIPALTSVMDSSKIKHSTYERFLVPKLFVMLLNEKHYEHTHTLNKESMKLVLEQWNKALEICPVELDIHPNAKAQGFHRFKSIVSSAESLTTEQLLTMIAEGNGIFSSDEAPHIDEHRAIRGRIRELPRGSDCVSYIDRLPFADEIYSNLEFNEISDSKLQKMIDASTSHRLTLRFVLDLITESDAPEPVRFSPSPAARPHVSIEAPSRPTLPLSSDLLVPEAILNETPSMAAAHTYDQMIRMLTRFAYEKAFRIMPQLFCDSQEVDPATGSPIASDKPLEARIEEGKTNLSSMMPTGFLGVAKYAQYLEVVHGTRSCAIEHTRRQDAINRARAAVRNLNQNEKRLLVTTLISGDTIETELNKLTEARRAVVKKLASDITDLASAMTEATRTGSYQQKEFAREIKAAYEQTYSDIASSTT